MFRELLGDAQTIRLDRWAVAVGLRRSYLDSLPLPRRAACLAVYDRGRVVREVLYVIWDQWQLDLHVMSAADGELPPADLDALAARCPGGGPLLCAVLMSRRAAGELLVALAADEERAEVFHARLAADYGIGWSVAARNPLVGDLIHDFFTNDIRHWWRAAMRYLDGRVVILHSEGAPATWGGGRFAERQFHPLPPGELIGASDAVWVDERLIGEGVQLLNESLDRPARDAKPFFIGLFALLKRGYLRLPGVPLRPLRMMPSFVGGRWLRRTLFAPPSAIPPLPPCVEPRCALYFHVPPTFTADAPAEQVCRVYRQLLQALDRRPYIRATVGWTRMAIDKVLSLDPELMARYRNAVAQGQVETACVLCRPLPMLTSSAMVRVMVKGWQEAAARVGLQAEGVIPADAGLTPGWGDALRGYGYRYIAIPEGVLHSNRPHSDVSGPTYVDGWTAVVFKEEIGRVLHLDVEAETLEAFLRHAGVGQGRVVAISLDADYMVREGLLEPLLERLEACDLSFMSLSDVAAMPVTGSMSVSQTRGVAEPWCGDEEARWRNALLDRIWGCRQGVEALAQAGRALAVAAPQPLHLLCPANRDEAERALRECRVQKLEWLTRLRAMPDVPADALGVLRVFEPHDRVRKGNLLQVSVTLPPGVQPDRVIFVDRDIVIPSQYLGRSTSRACYLLAVDIAAGGLRDLLVFPNGRAAAVEGLDVTPRRLLNPWLALLLDERGQVTSLRYQGRECLCCPGNLVRGYLLDADTWLYPERVAAEVAVSEEGPLRGAVTVRQVLAEGVVLTRRIALSLFNPLVECTTEIEFAGQHTLGNRLVIGEFGFLGEQVRWSLPLQAGYILRDVSSLSVPIFSADDVVDVPVDDGGMRYVVDRGRSRTFYYEVRRATSGVRVGLIASMPRRHPDRQRLEAGLGLGFPGCTYKGRYTYHYALLPLTSDVDARTSAYNYPLLWTFYEA